MYNGILECTMLDMLHNDDVKMTTHTVRGVINFINDGALDSFSKESDIVAFYDVSRDSKPLLLVERIPTKSVKVRLLEKKVAEAQKEGHLQGYQVTVSISEEDPKYVDVVCVVKNVYQNLIGA